MFPRSPAGEGILSSPGFCPPREALRSSSGFRTPKEAGAASMLLRSPSGASFVPIVSLVMFLVVRSVCSAAAVCLSVVFPTRGTLQYVGDQHFVLSWSEVPILYGVNIGMVATYVPPPHQQCGTKG